MIITKIRGEKKMIELKLERSQLIPLVEEYYREKEKKEVKVTISANKQCVGLGLYEMESCVTEIKRTEEIELLGTKQKLTKTISKEELQDVLNVLLKSQGYIVEEITYDDGLSSHWEGCYMNERLVKKAYFHGVTLRLTETKNRPKTRRMSIQ